MPLFHRQILLRILFMLIFSGYYWGITFFPHQHIFNGQPVVHSHFYIKGKGSDTKNPGHQHNTAAFELIATNSDYSCHSIGVTPPLAEPYATTICYHPENKIQFPDIQMLTRELRGPPIY